MRKLVGMTKRKSVVLMLLFIFFTLSILLSLAGPKNGIHSKIEASGEQIMLSTLQESEASKTSLPTSTKSYYYNHGWGSKGSGRGEFDFPGKIATYQFGQDLTNHFVYVADRGNNRIQKFDFYGNFISEWGSYGSNNGQFKSPSGIDIGFSNVYDASVVYVVDQDNHRIQVFDIDGNYMDKFGSKGTSAGRFNNPVDIAVALTSSYLYVLDRLPDLYGAKRSRVKMFYLSHSTGKYIFEREWELPGIHEGIAVDSNHDVYVSCRDNNTIYKYDIDGKPYPFAWPKEETNIIFDGPLDVAVDGGNNVFVVDAYNDRIVKFSKDGDYITHWGSHGSGIGEFNNPPIAIAKHSNSSAFVLQQPSSDRAVLKFSPALIIYSLAPSSGINTGTVDVTIDGTNFITPNTVTLKQTGQPDIRATNVTRVSATRITCRFPIIEAATGFWDLKLKSGSTTGYHLTVTAENVFEVTGPPAPTITSITPNSGPDTGPLEVMIAGTNFVQGTNEVRLERVRGFKVDWVQATNVERLSNTRIRCTLPLDEDSEGFWDVVVTSGLQSTTLLTGFTVVGPPTITSITPNSGTNDSSLNLTITGTNFVNSPNDVHVNFQKDEGKILQPTNMTWISESEITCEVNLKGWDTGYYDVILRTGAIPWRSVRLENGFLVSDDPATHTGSIRVFIEPQAAIDAGARWRLTSDPTGLWRESGDTATGLAPGTYTITFKEINGLNSPADMGLDLEEGESVTVDGH